MRFHWEMNKKKLFLRPYKYDCTQTVHECLLDVHHNSSWILIRCSPCVFYVNQKSKMAIRVGQRYFSFKPLKNLKINLAEMFIDRSCTKFMVFCVFLFHWLFNIAAITGHSITKDPKRKWIKSETTNFLWTNS